MARKLNVVSRAATPPIVGGSGLQPMPRLPTGQPMMMPGGARHAPRAPLQLLDAAAVAGVPLSAHDGAFESGADLTANQIRMREIAEGLADTGQRSVPPAPQWPTGQDLSRYVEAARPQPQAPVRSPPADLSSLPDRFALEVERKEDGTWIVRAPAIHVALFVAGHDLAHALAEAPGRLADIVRLDGEQPKRRKRK